MTSPLHEPLPLSLLIFRVGRQILWCLMALLMVPPPRRIPLYLSSTLPSWLASAISALNDTRLQWPASQLEFIASTSYDCQCSELQLPLLALCCTCFGPYPEAHNLTFPVVAGVRSDGTARYGRVSVSSVVHAVVASLLVLERMKPQEHTKSMLKAISKVLSVACADTCRRSSSWQHFSLLHVCCAEGALSWPRSSEAVTLGFYTRRWLSGLHPPTLLSPSTPPRICLSRLFPAHHPGDCRDATKV